jgi:alanine dehydrogenase
MTLVLGALDVEQLSPMPRLVEAIEQGLREQASGQVVLPSRLTMTLPDGGFFRVMPTLMNGSGLMGFKVFHGSARIGVRYLIAIYEQKSGELLALLDGHYLTAARTGATAGVAAKFMSNPGACTVAVIGSGLEARTNLSAICAVRPVTSVTVFSPNPEHRTGFAARMSRELGVEVAVADTPEQCVKGAEIVVVATNSLGRTDNMAYQGEWMRPGVHVSSIGSTMPVQREIDHECFGRAARIAVDSLAQVEHESGDVITAIKQGTFSRDKAVELHEIVGGKAQGRSSADEITLFKSVGTAVQDVMAGFVVYEEAVRHKRGRDVGAFLDVKKFG